MRQQNRARGLSFYVALPSGIVIVAALPIFAPSKMLVLGPQRMLLQLSWTDPKFA